MTRATRGRGWRPMIARAVVAAMCAATAAAQDLESAAEHPWVCSDDSLSCTVAREMASIPSVVLLAVLAGIFASAVWVAVAAMRRTDERPHVQNRGVAKVVAGPTLRDGVWCRMVASPDGLRRLEILGPNGWVPSHRDVAHLLQAIPGRKGPERPRL